MADAKQIYRIVVHPEPDFTVCPDKGMYFWFIAGQGASGVVSNEGCGWAESVEQAVADAKAYLARLPVGSRYEDVGRPVSEMDWSSGLSLEQLKEYRKLCAATDNAHVNVFTAGSPSTYSAAIKVYREALCKQLMFEFQYRLDNCVV